jgi:hypothetical protein
MRIFAIRDAENAWLKRLGGAVLAGMKETGLIKRTKGFWGSLERIVIERGNFVPLRNREESLSIARTRELRIRHGHSDDPRFQSERSIQFRRSIQHGVRFREIALCPKNAAEIEELVRCFAAQLERSAAPELGLIEIKQRHHAPR